MSKSVRNLSVGLVLLLFPAFGAEVSISRLANVTFEVADLDKARQFYSGYFGLEEAFDIKDEAGGIRAAFFKINDDQFLVFMLAPGMGANFKLHNISLLSRDLQGLQRQLTEIGLDPETPGSAPSGAPMLSLSDPQGNLLQFIRYTAASLEAQNSGKALGPKRVSDHLLHAGVACDNEKAGLEFYRKLGFREFLRGGPVPGDIRWINIMMPGDRGDYMELMVHTVDPPSMRQHICFEVTDIRKAEQELLDHGIPNRFKPFVAGNHRWIINVRDPYGIRVEVMGQEASPSEISVGRPTVKN